MQREDSVCVSNEKRDGAAPALPGCRRTGLEGIPLQGNGDSKPLSSSVVLVGSWGMLSVSSRAPLDGDC